MNRIDYQAARGRGYWLSVLLLAAISALALWAAHQMDSHGHVITGMNNQVVWGLPHVFAVFLILSASGALNPASLSTVFGRTSYTPVARLSGVFAISLLVGGLVILILDLGRPDRLDVALSTYNFSSIFTWNVFAYTGFVVVVAIYMGCLMQRPPYTGSILFGRLTFVWRIMLTCGTGAIFGFLVGREGYDAAILVPLFVAMSLSLGAACFLMGLITVSWWTAVALEWQLVHRLGRLLAIFITLVLLLVAAHNLTGYYAGRQRGVVTFLLATGGIYPLIFWVGQVGVGALVPLMLLLRLRNTAATVVAAGLVVLGGICQLYVLIVGVQAYPQNIFPGYVVSSSFFDGEVARYVPSIWEYLLGLGGVSIALLLSIVMLRVLPLVPRPSSADRAFSMSRSGISSLD